MRKTKFFVILGHFLPFYPPNNLENQNFEKMKQASGDVIILHTCTKKHNHMMYASWDMECNKHNFLPFWAIFCLLSPLLTPKIKIWKNCKKTSRYYPFKHVYHKWRSYDVWFLRYTVRGAVFCNFGPFLQFDPPNNPENQNFEKKNAGDIILHMCTIN